MLGLLRAVPLWGWGLLALGALLVVQTVRLANSHAEVAEVRAEYVKYQADIAKQAAADNQHTIDVMLAQRALEDVIAAGREKRQEQEKADLEKQLEEIRNAPREGDAPMSRNACAYYQRVYGRAVCAPDRSH